MIYFSPLKVTIEGTMREIWDTHIRPYFCPKCHRIGAFSFCHRPLELITVAHQRIGADSLLCTIKYIACKLLDHVRT
jgi:hypothetical protein